MKKIFLIGFKDLKVMFRDRAALILMLLAPFVLTIGLGLATGSMTSSSDSGISHIPVVIVNQDGGQLGDALVTTFQSSDLDSLVDPTISSNFEAAKKVVDDDKAAAAILVPAGFSDSIIPQDAASISNNVVQIELYTNPSRPTSAGVIRSILEGFLSQVETGKVSGTIVIGQMVTSGLISVDEAQAAGEAYGQSLMTDDYSSGSIKITSVNGEESSSTDVNTLALLAPGMALMFLMYTVSNGGRSLLVERSQGTLARLAVTPSRVSQVLAGKMFGIFLTGVVQMGILIGATSLLYKLYWGDPLGLIVLILAAVFGATGWGLLLCAIANTPGQVSTIGSALMLIFGILGGSFFSLSAMPDWVQWIAHVSPNAWGMDGFTTLALGGRLANLADPILGLLVMGAILFILSSVVINRRGIIRA